MNSGCQSATGTSTFRIDVALSTGHRLRVCTPTPDRSATFANASACRCSPLHGYCLIPHHHPNAAALQPALFRSPLS